MIQIAYCVCPLCLYQNDRFSQMPENMFASRMIGSTRMPCRKSRPISNPNKSTNSMIVRKMPTDTMMKYLSASALLRRKSSCRKADRKYGSAA